MSYGVPGHVAIRSVAEVPTQRQFTAWKLGAPVIRLIDVEAFGQASQVSAVAKELQPADVDYDALVVVCNALQDTDFALALRTARTHVSFASGAWLNGLADRLAQYCAMKAAL